MATAAASFRASAGAIGKRRAADAFMTGVLWAAAKAVACMWGRAYVVPDDIVNIAGPVLRHRLLLTPEAELDRFRPDDALRTVLSSVPVPR